MTSSFLSRVIRARGCAGVLICAALALQTPAAAWTPGQLLFGVYYGGQGWSMASVRALEAWTQKRHAIVVLFTDWSDARKTMDNLFQQQLPGIWNSGNVPLISWEPFTRGTTPADIERRIADGLYDAYVTTWAGRLKLFLAGNDGALNTADDRRVYLRPAHEMNGDWYPWSAGGGTTPADYVRMWQRIHDHFTALNLGPSHIQWVWAVNHTDVGPYRAEAYFPGDAWVDWVALDGYNWGTSQSWSSWTAPAEVFGAMASRLRTVSLRPLAITEVGSSSQGGSVAAKNAWIQQLYGWASQNDVRMVCYFNEDKETDWAIFGGAAGDTTFKSGRTTYRAYSAYRAAAGLTTSIGAQAGNVRLLTDAQFAGQ